MGLGYTTTLWSKERRANKDMQDLQGRHHLSFLRQVPGIETRVPGPKTKSKINRTKGEDEGEGEVEAEVEGEGEGRARVRLVRTHL